MTIEARGTFPPAILDSIDALVAGQKTLEDVVRWGLSRRPPRVIERVVIQDEYTHDVVLPWDTGVFLVYDTT